MGIALSGFMVPRLDKLGGWRECWLGMGAIALLLAAAGLLLAEKRNATPPLDHIKKGVSEKISGIGRLAAAYICEGFGYIISATFIVATLAGLVADRGGFTIPLLLAALSVSLGGVIIATDKRFRR
jgi:Uncharacterised MFS-type transporter YbfB